MTRTLVVAAMLSLSLVLAGGVPAAADSMPGGRSASTGGSVYVPVTPCRLLDTRTTGGRFAPSEQRSFQATGTSGGASPCGVAVGASAVEVAISTVSPGADGFLRAGPTGSATTATVLNFRAGRNLTNTTAITLSASGSLDLRSFNAASHYVLDVQGYFVAPSTIVPFDSGSVFVPITPCRIADTRVHGYPLGANQTSDFQMTGSDARFDLQGGSRSGCGVPVGATAVEGAVTAVSPSGNGYLRTWAVGSTPPNATFANFSANQSITNTGPLGVSLPGTFGYTGSGALTIGAYGSSTHLVIDIHGYYAKIADLPDGETGSLYTPTEPCRLADTRSGGGAPRPDGSLTTIQAAGSGSRFAAQGGAPGGCGVPVTARAIEGSVSAVGPARNGFFRVWPATASAPMATFANFVAAASTTNTGAVGLGSGPSPSISLRGFGSSSHYTVDVQGYFAPHVRRLGSVRRLDTPWGVPSGTAISADASTVAFVIDPDGRRNLDLYVWDRATGTTKRITNTTPNIASPSISADGRYVAYESADPAQGADAWGRSIYIWDRTTGLSTRMKPGTAPQAFPSISADGSAIAYQEEISSGNWEIRVWDRTTSTDVTVAGQQSYGTQLSADGSTLVFSSATALTPDDTDRLSDVYAWDRATGTLSRLSPGGLDASGATVSADGGIVSYTTLSRFPDTSDRGTVHVWDRANGSTVVLPQGNVRSEGAQVTADGSKVVFGSVSSDLAADDANALGDLFLWDRVTGAVEQLTDTDVSIGYFASSANGDHLTWVSLPNYLTLVDTYGRPSVFTWDR